MCWSFEASIVTWIIGLVTGIFLLSRNKKNDIIMGLLILTYSLMQFWECLMWRDQNCGKLNKFATQAAYYTLWAHVLAIGIGMLIEYNVSVPIMIGFILMICSVILRPKKWECSLKSKNGHLEWGFNPYFYMLVFTVAISLSMYYIKPTNTAILISFLFLSSFILSYLLNQKYNTVGSFWCWICAAFCFLFIKIN